MKMNGYKTLTLAVPLVIALLGCLGAIIWQGARFVTRVEARQMISVEAPYVEDRAMVRESVVEIHKVKDDIHAIRVEQVKMSGKLDRLLEDR